MCLPKPAGVLNVLDICNKFLIDFARAVENQLLYVSELESKSSLPRATKSQEQMML